MWAVCASTCATRTSCVRRPIRPEDEPQHRAFVELLQPENLRLRFLNARSELPHSELARMAQNDYARKMIDFLARRSTQRMVVYVLRENEAMRELAQSQGFVVDAVASDADALFLALTLQAR